MPVIYPSTYEYEKFGKAFLEQIVEWVSAEYRPEDLFTEAELREWAEEHGFVEEGAEA